MSDKIEIGTRVRISHKPGRDREYGGTASTARRANDGREGKVIGRSDAHGLCFEVDTQSGCCAWYEPDELTPVDDARAGDGAHLHSIVESAQAFSRAAFGWQREATEAKAAIAGWVARCDALREEAEREKAARVEAERREAAAKSIADDATIALAKEQSVRRGAVEARDKAIADREALEARIQVAQVALDAVRLALEGCEDVAAVRIALDRLDRALRGVPAVDRGRQGERFHAPATIEERLAEVERLVGSMSNHLAALDQRVAGLGNGLDEVRAGVHAPGEFDARPSGDR